MSAKVRISIDSRQGRREYMEDFAKWTELEDGRICVVVCDGHGGSRCAQYAVENIITKVNALKPNEWNIGKIIEDVSNAWDKICLTALNAKRIPESVEERAALFTKASAANYYNEQLHSGTTVVACIIDVRKKAGVMANLGDSRGIWKDLGKKRTRLRSTKDHTPHVNDLGPLGGDIVHEANDVPRINGDLAVGRALGDNSEELMGTVLHTPVVTQFEWENRLRVVLATDGLWDVVSNSRAMKRRMASTLVTEALVRKSTDNVTVAIMNVTYPDQPPAVGLLASYETGPVVYERT